MRNEIIIEPGALQVLSNELPNELHTAILELVYNKYLLDKIISEHGNTRLAGALYDGCYGPHEATSFYRLVFPFIPLWNRSGDTFSALVPTQQVIGASWRWRTKNVEQAKRDTLLAKLRDPKNASKTYFERAQYMWIRPLGLVLPHEGKNRVDFLRDMGLEHIPACVTPYDYPASDRLAQYRVKVHGRTEYWAVLDGKWVERLAHPEWAMPILKAYGVSEGQKWPDEFPSVDNVVAAFGTPTGNPAFLSDAIVNLEKLAADSTFRAETVCCSVLDLKALRFRPSFWLYWLGIFLICIVAMCLLPSTWTTTRIIVGVGYGTCLGTLMAYVIPGFWTVRAALKGD